MQPRALPGFRDFYPDDFALRAHIFETWRRVAGCYGFEEYDGPPLEPLELYTAKSGEEIVGQLYAFTDKGNREVALRPEMTPTLARMVAARANGLKKPIRWFSIPQLFRYERQQRGRLREHFQLNCDLIGEPGPLADAEVIALAIDVMRAFGFGPEDFRVRLFDRALLNQMLSEAGISGDGLDAAYHAIDKWERVDEAHSLAVLADAGLEQPQRDAVRAFVGGAIPDGAMASEAGQRFTKVLEALRAMGLGEFLLVDPKIVRGLAYYTGTVFELFDAKGELRAICGGGRYDRLAGALGGVDLPAVGFGFGDVVLGELLKDRGLLPEAAAGCDVFVAAVTGEDLPSVLALAHELRDAGIRVEYTLGGQNIGKQLKLADARNARHAIVIGPDDRAAGRVMLKDLQANEQHAVPADEIMSRMTERVVRNGQ